MLGWRDGAHGVSASFANRALGYIDSVKAGPGNNAHQFSRENEGLLGIACRKWSEGVLSARIPDFVQDVVRVEQGFYAGTLAGAGGIVPLDFHKNGRTVAPQGLSHSFDGIHFKSLYIQLEEGDWRESIHGEEIVTADDLDGNRLRGGVVGQNLPECSCALI